MRQLVVGAALVGLAAVAGGGAGGVAPPRPAMARAADTAGVSTAGVPETGAPASAAPAPGLPGAGVSAPGVPASVTYAPPVPPPVTVVRGFEPPPTPFAAGHRGVDLRAADGSTVWAAAAGVVRFAGTVADRPLVVIAHADGVLTEYEPVRPGVGAGDVVARGDAIGTLDGAHGDCARNCLHWGARRNGVYFDPLTLLRPLGPVRLLPWQ